jgi:WhiB family transcriptional regulator, redox-sensing transcriptional regulator
VSKHTSTLTKPVRRPVVGWPRATLNDWEWQRHGHCVGVPSEVFFPEDEERRQRRHREAQAKLICEGCPVLAACREHALRTPETYGVWGAMSPTERAQDRSRRRARCDPALVSGVSVMSRND